METKFKTLRALANAIITVSFLAATIMLIAVIVFLSKKDYSAAIYCGVGILSGIVLAGFGHLIFVVLEIEENTRKE